MVAYVVHAARVVAGVADRVVPVVPVSLAAAGKGLVVLVALKDHLDHVVLAFLVLVVVPAGSAAAVLLPSVP